MRRLGILSAAALPLFLFLSPAAAGDVVTLSLADALDAAMANNLQVQNAALATAQSQQDRTIADGRRLPELDIEGSYTRLELPAASDIPVPGFGFPESDADVAVKGTLPLYTGGRISSARRLAATGVELSSRSEGLTRDDVILETASTYLELLAAQQFAVIAKEALDTSRRHLEDVRLLLEKGQVAQVDLFRSELDEAERERDIASAEANLTRRAEQLSSIIFPDRHVTITAQWEVPPPRELPDLEEWVVMAEDGSGEVAAAKLSLTLAEEGVSAARAERRPVFGLFGAYGAQGEDFSYTSRDRYWNAGLSLSFPLYRGGRTSLAVEKALLEEEKARNSLTIARRGIRRGVVERHAAVVLALKQHAAAVKAVRAAGENHRVTDLKYREGLVTNTDVIDALLSLSRARFDHVQALKDYHINRFGLMRLAGTIEDIL